MGSNHALSQRKGSGGNDEKVTMDNVYRNPMILLNPNNSGKKSQGGPEDEMIYKTYDSKSNQEVFSDKMNL